MASRILASQRRVESIPQLLLPPFPTRGFSLRLKIAAVMLLIIGAVAVTAPWIAPYDPSAISPSDRLLPPNLDHLFGTDMFGRDLFSRVLYGASPTLQVALGAVIIGALPGLALGMIAGSKRGVFDQVVTQIADAWNALPGVLVALVMIAALGRSVVVLVLALGISSIPTFYRMVRAETMRVAAEPFVEAAVSLGACHRAVLMRHIIPNIAPSLLALVTISVGRMLLATSALSFIGLGAPPPSPEWGSLLAEGRAHMEQNWWLIWFPGATIAVTTFAIYLFGNSFRDSR